MKMKSNLELKMSENFTKGISKQQGDLIGKIKEPEIVNLDILS